MAYECIKDFIVNLIDENGFIEKKNGVNVRKGSIWKENAEAINMTGAELHLENATGLEWVEISRKRLVSHFRPINV